MTRRGWLDSRGFPVWAPEQSEAFSLCPQIQAPLCWLEGFNGAQMFVRTFTGRTIALGAEGAGTIGDVKNSIQVVYWDCGRESLSVCMLFHGEVGTIKLCCLCRTGRESLWTSRC